MAERPTGYGMTAELNKKKAEKFDPEQADEVFQWIEEIIDEPVPGEHSTIEEVQDSLKDGIVLCKLVNAIEGKDILKAKKGNPFILMENIDRFLSYCNSKGCKKLDMFQTVDLYEGQNIPQVINGLLALGRKIPDINSSLPVIGPRESAECKREFTQEQLEAGKGIIGLQMGTNTCASQSGMTAPGTGRQIH